MFRKLLKYDMRAMWKISKFLIFGALGLAIIASLAFNYAITNPNSHILITLPLSFISIAAFFGIFAAIYTISILVFYRFYKTMFSDQGYLTFTLPVKRKTLLLEKLMFGFIWEAISAVTIIIIALICFTLIPPLKSDNTLLPGLAFIFDVISKAFASIGGWTVVYILLGIILVAVSSVLSLLLIYLCITLASIAFKKYKLLGAFGIYMAISTGLGLISEIIAIIASISIFSAPVFDVWFFALSAFGQNLIISFILLLVIAATAAVSYLLYRIVLKKIKYKLNLT